MGMLIEKGREIDNIRLIKEELECAKRVVFKVEGGLEEWVSIKNCAIKEEGLCSVYMEYKVLKGEGRGLKEKECQKELEVLNPEGDRLWGRNLIKKVWGDDYPTSICVDKYTGEVYELHIYKSKVEFRLFGKMRGEELELYKEDILRERPYKIKLKEEALYKYLEGEEGSRYLRENMELELDCGVKVRVARIVKE